MDMTRSAPVLSAVTVCVVLVHAWTGYAFCRVDEADNNQYAGGALCHTTEPHSHEGHHDHEFPCDAPWGNCPTPSVPHSHDLVLAVFSSDDGPVDSHLEELTSNTDSAITPATCAASGFHSSLTVGSLPGGLRHCESSIPRYARLEVFLL